MKRGDEEKKDIQLTVTDLDAIKDNTEQAVNSFAERYICVPRFTIDDIIMDQAQLRDAMGLRATFESGDPWPRAEQLLMDRGFRWHMLGGIRVMYLRERDNTIPSNDGWNDGELIDSE